MCTIGEDEFGDEGAADAMLPGRADAVFSTGNCSKCDLSSNILYKLNFRAAECCDCFLNYARHKFRAALGAAKALPREAEVLLLLDGSSESLVLLDMLHFAQTQNTFKRLHCIARVLYLDYSSASVLDLLPSLIQLSKHYAPFRFYAIHSSAQPSNVQLLQNYSIPYTHPNQKRFRSLTAQRDYLHQQRKFLIGGVAAQLHCSHVFEPSISTTLATDLLTSIALGRGGSVALDVSLVDDRLQGGIKLLRPLKDLNEQEVQFYVHAQQLQPFQRSQCDLLSGASLQNLTNTFVSNLQLNYASTVSTVFRTGDKIAPNHQKNGETLTCLLCQSVLDSCLSDTLLAIEYSRAVSVVGATLQTSNNESSLEQQARAELTAAANLCHACRNIKSELISGALI